MYTNINQKNNQHKAKSKYTMAAQDSNWGP